MSLTSTAPSSASPAATSSARIASREFAWTASIGALFLFGFALRLRFSGGPLWNDEIWSLRNLLPIRHFWQILWGISHDNNHFLNSLWLFFASPIGDDAGWLRLPSVLAGALAIPAMAYLGARRSRASAIAAAALTACSFFQFTYSVEARGYATATLALLVAFGALERALEHPAGRARWVLAAAAGLGFLSHLASGPAMALLGAIGFGEIWRRERHFKASFEATLRLFWPAGVAMLPTLGFVAAGYVHTGGFTIGFIRPYVAAHAIGAMANLEMTTFGLDPTSRVQVAFALLVLPILLLGAIVLAALPSRRLAYCAFLIGIPAAVLILHPPNTHVARYFFAASPFLLLLVAETFGALWDLGGWRRVVALVILARSLTGDGFAIANMESGKQKPWDEALATVAASGDLALSSSFDFNVGKSVDYFNRTHGTKIDLTPPDRLCERQPTWHILEMPGDGAPYPTLALGGAKCRLIYALTGVYDLHIPSQLPWALYRLKIGAER